RGEGETRIEMAGAEVEDAVTRLPGSYDEATEVAVVCDDDASFGLASAEEGAVAVADQAFPSYVEHVEALLLQVAHDFRVDVLVREETRARQRQASTSAVTITSFSRNRAAYRTACSTSAGVR